jgi:hypothetical protein
VTDSERCGITDLSDGEFNLLQLEHGQVGARIPADQPGGNHATVWQAHADLLVAFDRMVSCHDDVLSPVYTTRWNPRPGMHGHDASAHVLDSSSQIMGKGQ